MRSVHFADDGGGDVFGNIVLGDVVGDVFGNIVLGDVVGDVLGDVVRDVFGNVVRDVVGDVLGLVVANVGLGDNDGNRDDNGDDVGGLGVELGVDIDVVPNIGGEDVRTGLRNEIPSCLNHGISNSTGIQCCCPSHKSALIAYRCISSSTTTSP